MRKGFLVELSIPSILSRFNRSSIWRTEFGAWGQRLIIPSADRLLYAVLHRSGWMGRDDRRFFEDQLKPGMKVLDVGANIGLYTLLFSDLVGELGKVYSFEPDPISYASLKEACRVNNRSNIRHFPCALGNSRGKALLQKSIFNSGDNRIKAGAVPDVEEERERTPLISVDRADFLLPSETVDFIKMDVQGWEFHALSGMGTLIRRSDEVQIYFEFWPQGLRNAGSSPDALFDLLHSYGLSVLREQRHDWQEVRSSRELLGQMRNNQYINLLAKRLK
jgi:FkbM family methyltransferase